MRLTTTIKHIEKEVMVMFKRNLRTGNVDYTAFLSAQKPSQLNRHILTL